MGSPAASGTSSVPCARRSCLVWEYCPHSSLHTVCFTLLTFDKKVKVKAAQSRLTLCDPMDYTAHGILQARILEWGAFPSSRGSSRPRDRT